MEAIETLALEMETSVEDLMGFLAGLNVWIAKGYDLDQAIEKHMDQMRRFANAGLDGVRALKPLVLTTLWEGLRERAAA